MNFKKAIFIFAGFVFLVSFGFSEVKEVECDTKYNDKEMSLIFANTDILKRVGCTLYVKNKKTNKWMEFKNIKEIYVDKNGKEDLDYSETYYVYGVDRKNHIVKIDADYYDFTFLYDW